MQQARRDDLSQLKSLGQNMLKMVNLLDLVRDHMHDGNFEKREEGSRK